MKRDLQRLGGHRLLARYPILRSEWAILTGILVLAVVLRVYQIGTENLWSDEWLSLHDAAHIPTQNRHRPLFYLLLRLWLLFGSGDTWVRLPALCFGVVAIALLYLVARRLADVPAGLAACLIMAVAVPELNHSQEVRMYTMASMLTLASLLALLHWVDAHRPWVLGAHLVLAYLAIVTTPTVIYGLCLAGLMAAVVLLRRLHWNAAIQLITGYALVFAAWWPLHYYAKLAIKGGGLNWIQRPSDLALLLLHGALLTETYGGVRDANISTSYQLVVSVLAFALVATALILARPRLSLRKNAWALAVWFYGIAIGVYVISLVRSSVWMVRYFHYAAPALYLLLGVGVVSLARRWRPVGWLAAATLLGLIGIAAIEYYRLPNREQWRDAAAAIAQQAAPEDIVAVVGLGDLFNRYYHGRGIVREIYPRLWEMPQQTDTVFADLLSQIPPHRGQTWIVVREDPRFQQVGFLERLVFHLRNRGTAVETRIFRNIGNQLDVLQLRSADPARN